MSIKKRKQLAELLAEYNMELKERDLLVTQKAVLGDNEAYKEMENILDTQCHIQALLVALDKECESEEEVNLAVMDEYIAMSEEYYENK